MQKNYFRPNIRNIYSKFTLMYILIIIKVNYWFKDFFYSESAVQNIYTKILDSIKDPKKNLSKIYVVSHKII